ncbi:MAG: DNA internalization-related competence protein ComEC/Rec2 [Pseudomonadota bacterium]
MQPLERLSGEKRRNMFQRPLIPLVICLGGGILVGHEIFPSSKGLSISLFISVTLLLLGAILLPSRFRIPCLLAIFFLTGILLDLERRPPSRLLSFANRLNTVTLEGMVLPPIELTQGMAKLRVRAKILWIMGKTIAIDEDVGVTVYDGAPPLSPGERIRFPARLRPFRNFNNPGRYDYESAMKIKGLTCAAYVPDGRYIVPMGPRDPSFPIELLEKVQGPIMDFFRNRLSPEDYALYCALILGQRQAVGNELREPFNQTGLGHVLAVSGLHVGLVAWVAFLLVKRLLSCSYRLALRTDIRRLTAILTCLPVVGYTFLTGFQVPGQRAMIMALAFLWSLILGREREIWSTLALSGLLVLALDPHSLFSISFQLSFSAVIGILWLTPSILKRLPSIEKTRKKKNRFLNSLLLYFVGLIAVSLAATLFLLPITSFYFHRVSIAAVPANVTVIPILGLWVIPFGLISVLLLPLSHYLAGLSLQLGAWGLDLMMAIVRFWAGFSWSNFWVITPNLIEIGLFYILMFFTFFFTRWRWAKVGLILTVVLVLVDLGYWFHRVSLNKDLRVTFLDMRNGNAALIELPGGEKMLIDGGGFSHDQFDVGKMVVAPYLWHSKIRRIDYLVLSHPQSDHMNGFRFIAKAFRPKEFWWNGDQVDTPSFVELMEVINDKGIKKLLPADLAVGRETNGVKIEVLHPRPGDRSKELYDSVTRLNNNSLVLKISFNGRSFLFPGDLERQGEEVLISNAGHLLKSDILLSPHHGSGNSSSPAFLDRVRPGICVISTGKSESQNPSQEQIIRRLKKVGCRVFRISRTGAVQVRIGANGLQVNTFLKDNASYRIED